MVSMQQNSTVYGGSDDLNKILLEVQTVSVELDQFLENYSKQ